MDGRSQLAEFRRYKDTISRLFERARADGLSIKQCHKIYKKTLNDIDKVHTPQKSIARWKKILGFIIVFIATIYIVNMWFNGKPLNLFLCKTQEFIYPGLRLLRILSIPIIKTFPSLTEYYDETCLIQNPFFYISDMECRPCYNIHSVIEITVADTPFEQETMTPFIYKTTQKHIDYTHMYTLYIENKNVFDNDSPKITINNRGSMTISEFFIVYKTQNNNSYKWRINRMLPAIKIRSLFPRPEVVPRLGQSTERFVIIDNPESMSYDLPEPECNYVFVIQSKGERVIELKPTKECSDQCKTVTVRLTAPYMLWYNWWYWRPVSHSTEFNSTSVSYIGSYC